MSNTRDQANSGSGNGPDQEANLDNTPDLVALPPSHALASNPDITLYFSGLMLMAYNTGGWLEAGVHSTVPNHTFKIYVKKITRGRVSLFETHFDRSMPLTDEIRFEVEGATGNRIGFYQNDPFDRDSFSQFFGADEDGPLSVDDVRDFRWIIDFENQELHGKKLAVDGRLLSPRLRINNGIFYTAKRTLTTFNRFTKNDSDSKVYFGAIAHVIAANVSLQGTQTAKLRIGDQINLSFAKEAGTVYKIAFVNDPNADVQEHNDFKEYYRLIPDEQSVHQFDLCPFDDLTNCQGVIEKPLPPGFPQPNVESMNGENAGANDINRGGGSGAEKNKLRSGSDRVPCATGFLGRSNGLPPTS